MKYKKLMAAFLSAAMALSLCAAGAAAEEAEVDIVLSDSGITVDGRPVSEDPADAVYVGAEIVYYKDGTDETYGEGSESEKHSAEEAAAHTVVTITQPGTYRLSGSLSAGQIAIDLGEDAETDPGAVVTVILDNVDVTCTVAPALIFYNVYECCEADEATASPVADTSAAGANVVIAAGSVNTFTGSHVARIYREGTTKKLHKYDGAFYSKKSMNINGDNGDDSGVLNIVADNEGLNSELHLTINGGTINIQAQDDGINTNEDFISVTTINGGKLTVNAGLGAEGDGIDSNGYLTINGGTVWTMARYMGADGGVDADGAITINGGTLYAFGSRNDAADSASAQPYMELSFASTLPVGSEVKVTDEAGNALWSAVTEKTCQSITLTAPGLELDTVYRVYVDGVLQCYSGNSFGMMGGGMMPGGGMGGMMPPGMGGMEPPAMGEMPQGGMEPPAMGEMPQGGMEPPAMGAPEMPEGFDPSQMGGGQQGGMMPGGMGGQTANGSGSTDFTLTETVKSFSGVCDSAESGKTSVSFTVEGTARSGRETVIDAITAITPSADIDPALVQVTVADDPSEDYSASCLLSEGLEAVNALLPGDDGEYTLTVAVVAGTEGYTGATQISFVVGALPFVDVNREDGNYNVIKAVYEAGLMIGVDEGTFLGNGAATRAQAAAVLARLAEAEGSVTDAFSDVKETAWYAGVVGWAYENGLVEADGQGRFNPESQITGEEMGGMLEGFAAATGWDISGVEARSGVLDRNGLAEVLAGLMQSE